MENEITERVKHAITTVYIVLVSVALFIVVIGTAALPAVLAYLFGWTWLVAYPVMLLVAVGWLSKFRKK